MPAFDFVLARRYRLIAPLGEGGMAAVYRARDLRLNREVAVKVLREELTADPAFLHRFQREAEFVASLSHPHIVPVHDVGEDKGTHYIVMEYIRGRTLRDTIDAAGRLSAGRTAEIMRAVLAALAYAHGKGLIHRDVKPHNILLTTDGTARLADFGIAHLAEASYTRTAAILGSAHYLSPEQSRGEEATVASDLYACGIVLYEMLTGRPPFDGPNALAIAHQHLHDEPPSITVLAPQTPPALTAAIRRALSKSPEDRFPDAEEFSAALDTVSAGSDTEILPLLPDRTQTLTTVTEARTLPVAANPPPAVALELRRSGRRVILAGFIAAGLLGAASEAARYPIDGYALPAYPSVPYLVAPAAAVLLLILSWLHVRSWRYRMNDDAAVLQWGLFARRRFGVPIRFITTLELKQSVIDRLLGVGTVEMCARDQHGEERRLVLEDLPSPHRRYDEVMRFLGRAGRTRPILTPARDPSEEYTALAPHEG